MLRAIADRQRMGTGEGPISPPPIQSPKASDRAFWSAPERRVGKHSCPRTASAESLNQHQHSCPAPGKSPIRSPPLWNYMPSAAPGTPQLQHCQCRPSIASSPSMSPAPPGSESKPPRRGADPKTPVAWKTPWWWRFLIQSESLQNALESSATKCPSLS